MVNLLRSPNYKVVEQAAVTLRNLSVNGLWPVIQFATSECILTAASTDANKVYFGTDGALPPLVALLRSPQLAVQEQAAVILRNLSLTAENERNIIQEGGLPAVIALLRTNEPRLQVPAKFACLEQKSLPRMRSAIWFCREGDDVMRQVHAAVILRNLSVNSESEVKIVQEGSLPPLINLLRSNDVDVQATPLPFGCKLRAGSAALSQCRVTRQSAWPVPAPPSPSARVRLDARPDWS